MDQLDGRHLRVGIAASAHMTGSYEVANQSEKLLTIMDLLRSQLNFTYQLITSDSRSIGFRHDNGSWSGLIGLLQRNEVDIIAARVPLLPTYIDAMDMSIPLGQDEWITLQKQISTRNSLSGLLSPFKMEVWLLVALSVMAMVPVMFSIYRLYLKFRPETWNEFRGHVSDFILFVVVSLLRQDHKLRISIHSQRVLMATWWIAGIVLTTFYTANLTASLARPFRPKSVEHPDELSLPMYKEVRWLTLQDDLLANLIGLATNENATNFLRILHQHVKNGRGQLISTIEGAINLVESQGFVWFGEENTLLEVLLTNYRSNRAMNATQSNLCTFLVTEKSYMTVEYGFAFAKNSSLTEVFNKALRVIDQTGILEYIHRPRFTGKNPCSLTGGYTSRPMQLGDFLGLFYVVSIGLGISFVVFTTEKIVHLLKNWWHKKRAVNAPPEDDEASNEEQVHRIHVIVPSEMDLAAIDRLTEEIDQLLSPDYDFRGILHGLLYTK